MQPCPAARPRSRRTLPAAAAIFVLSVALFWPATRNGFTAFDDDAYVSRNVWVLEGLSGAGLRWAFTTFHEANWHPLTWLSHMLDATLFGAGPAGHHLTSVLLHAGAATLFFLFLQGATGAPGRSAAAAALFAVHPLRVESVAWVAERKDVLCAFFWMLALLAHLAHARRPGASRRAAVLGLFALALLAKPAAIALPLVLLLADVWPLGRWRPRSAAGAPAAGSHRFGALVLEKAPLLALAAASAAVTWAAQSRGGAVGTLETYSLAVRAANAVASCGVYLRQTLWPLGLAAMYPHPRALPPLPQLAGWAALLAGVSLAAARSVRRVPAAAVGWLWYLVTLAPALGLVQVGVQAHADRYAYLPHTGLMVAAVWGGAAALARARAARAAPLAAAALLAPLLPLTRAQIATWHDTRTLLEHAIAVVPGNWPAHLLLAMHLQESGDPEGARAHVRELQRIRPDLPAAHGGPFAGTPVPTPAEARLEPAAREPWRAGLGALRAGRFEEAARRFTEVLAAQPAHGEALNDLGLALAGAGDRAGAAARFREAARLLPGAPEPLVNLGNVLLLAGDAAGAVDAYRRALALDPQSAAAQANLGEALLVRGERAAALFAFREALRLHPGHARARSRLEEVRTGGARGPAALPAQGTLDYLLLS